MLREKRYVCSVCGNGWTQMVVVGDPIDTECCGVQAKEVMGAPAVKFRKPYFNRALGVYIKDAQHEEQVLKNANSYRPSKQDMYKAIDGGAVEDNRPTFNEANVRAIAEKTFSELRLENQIEADGTDKPNRRIRRSVE